MSKDMYKSGDRVRVIDNPVDRGDRQYSGKVGVVHRYMHQHMDRAVFEVLLDGNESWDTQAIYGIDLVAENSTGSLESQLKEAEAKVAELKKRIEDKERDASTMPIATVVTFKDSHGAASMTKQAENSWLYVYPSKYGDVRTLVQTDAFATDFLSRATTAVIRKP